MKKKKITYAIRGFMTYVAVIFFGKARMKVTFSDGSITGTGTKPATFTTDNYIIQKGIEQSEQFKKGQIYIHSTYELDEEVEIERNPEPVKPEEIADNPEQPEETEQPEEQKAESPEPVVQEEAEPETLQPLAVNLPSEEIPAEDNGEGNVKVFACNDDARDYLESEFGVDRNKLKLRKDIISLGEAFGVQIVISGKA